MKSIFPVFFFLSLGIAAAGQSLQLLETRNFHRSTSFIFFPGGRQSRGEIAFDCINNSSSAISVVVKRNVISTPGRLFEQLFLLRRHLLFIPHLSPSA
jgi:hypothetical protein